MRIDIVHVGGCPNLERASVRVLHALDSAGARASVHEIEVASHAAAERAGMRGSPTILIDGRDPFPVDADEPSLSCRLYRTEAGIEGAPSVAQLRGVLTGWDTKQRRLTFLLGATRTIERVTPLADRTVEPSVPHVTSRRRIGPLGTMARVTIGALLLGDVVRGHAAGGWRADSWVLGVVVLPCITIMLHGLAAHLHPRPIATTGPLGHVINVGVFLALWLTPDYAPALGATSDAALIFYGSSMLVAALRGSPACEVTVVSNWLLGRDDRVGCALFLPVDAAEASRR